MRIRDYEKWMNEDEDFQFRKEGKKLSSFKKMKRDDLTESEIKFPDKKRLRKK